MSGRHSGGTSGGLRISALSRTVKLIFKLAPRQLNDEIALAKIEIKRKGIQLGVAAAFLAVALVFVAFLLIGLVVAAIMGLATIMPAWLAALLVCGVFLLIALIVGLVGFRKFKKAMPLMPEETVRGLKYDLGIAKEGSAFDAAVLDPDSKQYKAAKAAKAEADAKAKAEKEAKKAAEPDFGPQPTEAELRRRVVQRRTHLTGVRDELAEELDVKTQAQALLAVTQARLQDGKEQLSAKVAGFKSSAGRSAKNPAVMNARGAADQLGQRWKPLAALAASSAALLFLLRELLKG
ncbi:putative membrane protein YqjE [Arthrobacter sp. V4I6]|uniref:phage holin family protein n=1 Tax=unclassified Arthrobacter TaxID=235627 RepID=UPI00278324B8|nr:MULTISPECIES: phage holin family protein [unclassified Arthrobacter]MDQ0821998.1 putative membrane protein YqjE [Arthrobacter sp. V1I7]MDQ0856267.1 putative membrane protein YqjE [Arthrobacter sp. V4I6]